MQTLTVKARGTEALEDVRGAGLVPAVFYGAKEKPQSISIDAKVFEKLFKEAGETTVITLQGVGEDKDTLIHDVQVHPVTGKAIHADFYVLEKGKKVRLNIPLTFGSAPAEKAGHILVKALHEIEIEVAPQDIPHEIAVDLTSLNNVGDHVLASDIKLPASAELITGPEEIVASVTAFEEEKESAPLVIPPASEVAAPEEGASTDKKGE
jgi:large subunit ribosomal protein L25